MARDNRLRPTDSDRPVATGRFALLRSRSPAHIAAILAIVAAAFLAVYHLAGIGGGTKAHSEPAFLKDALGARQRSAVLVREPRLTPDGGITFTDPSGRGDFRLLPVAILSVLGSNIAPAGLAWKLKQTGSGGKVELRLDDSSFPAPFVIDPAIVASAVTTNETAGSKKVLDLSRPIRAGPGAAQAIDVRPAAPSDPDSRRYLSGD
jgi:hypothetical protein